MVLRAITDAGGPAVRTVVVTVVSILLVLRGRWRSARTLVAAVGGTGLANTVIKWLVERRRPRPIMGIRQAGGYSFPSGHSSGTLAVTGALAYLVWHETGSPRAAVATGLLGAVTTGLVGYSRVVLGHHHSADILGGYLLGAGWLVVVCQRRPIRNVPPR